MMGGWRVGRLQSHTYASVILRILASVPLALLVLFSYGHIENLERSSVRQRVALELYQDERLLDYMVANQFEDFSSVLYLIRGSQEFSDYLADPSEATLQEASALFMRIGNNRPYILRVAYLDINGLEEISALVRDDATGAGLWSDVFRTIRSTPLLDQPQFSSLEQVVPASSATTASHSLVVIDGALPVYREGEFAGALAVSIDGNVIVSLFNSHLGAGDVLSLHGVIDSGGRWVYRREIGDPTGSVLDPQAVESFSATDPFLWRIIATGSAESVVDGSRNAVIRRINPFPIVDKTTIAPYLTAISLFSDDALAMYTDSFVLHNRPLKWLLSLFVLAIGIVINLLVLFRKNEKQLARIGNLVSEYAYDGVVILDNAAQTTSCNRTFEYVSGFTRNEVLTGKGIFRTLDAHKLTQQVIIEATMDDGSFKTMAWLDGNGFHSLTHLFLSTVSTRHNPLSSHMGMVSMPKALPAEHYGRLFTEGETGSVDKMVDTYPLMIFSTYLQTDITFRLYHVHVSNLGRLQQVLDAEFHHRLSLEIAKRFYRIAGVLDVFRFDPGTFVLGIRDSGMVETNVISSVFEEAIELNGKLLTVNPLCGVSLPSTEVKDAAVMLRQARMALVILDHLGATRLQIYNEGVNRQIHRSFYIVHAFQEAQANGALSVAYQPIVDAKTDTIIGAEALSRWNDPDLGPISPAEFIPVLERNRLYGQLGSHVLKHVLAFLRTMDVAAERQFAISINACAAEMEDRAFVQNIVTAVEEAKIPKDRLIIELTESNLVKDLVSANGVVSRLRRQGFAVEIDDFGTGFSSLSYLKHLKVDVLKIDRSFLMDYPERDNGSLFRAIVGMAKDLGMRIIAEGVETEAHMALIRETGCDYYQGFLFSKALEPRLFLQLYEAHVIRSEET
jgi:EAL domain-containing protein (putative c-di-GMP-specific phosphodiesterase class I)